MFKQIDLKKKDKPTRGNKFVFIIFHNISKNGILKHDFDWSSACMATVQFISSTNTNKTSNSIARRRNNTKRSFRHIMDRNLTMLRDFNYVLFIFFVIYCMWKYIRSLNNRQNEFKTISDTSAPIIYNTNNNIHIWLAQIENY